MSSLTAVFRQRSESNAHYTPRRPADARDNAVIEEHVHTDERTDVLLKLRRTPLDAAAT